MMTLYTLQCAPWSVGQDRATPLALRSTAVMPSASVAVGVLMSPTATPVSASSTQDVV